MMCTNQCSGNGQCITMQQNAALLDRGLQPRPYYTYASPWDANMVYGCACDTGYSGYDCSQRICPLGNDPMLTGGRSDVQLLRCDLSGSTTTNMFTISYRGAVTLPFAPSISAFDLKVLLDALPTIGQVTVSYSRGFTLCSNEFSPLLPASGNVASITFVTEPGDVPAIVVLDQNAALLTGVLDNSVALATDGQSLTYATGSGTALATSVAGTTVNLPCNGRGTCNSATGACACYVGYASSNRMGIYGTSGDCGFVTMPITACPGTPECSGNGVCSGNPAYACTCNAGWSGGSCSERTCPQGRAWFDFPSATNVAHAFAECSNRGACDRATGACACQPGFTGAACDRMACPGIISIGGSTRVCSGHGRCLSESALASYATVNGDATPYTYGANPNNAATWDGKATAGCLCDAGYQGYDCSQRTCAFGNDIALLEWDTTRTDEVQSLSCTLVSSAPAPTFVLRFRQQQTAPISWSVSASALQAALSALSTIGSITVSYGPLGPTTACSTAPGTSITFSFSLQHGDVPPIQVAMDESTLALDSTYGAGLGWDGSSLQFAGGNPVTSYATAYTYVKTTSGYAAGGVRTLEVVKGASGNEECSNRGTCNRATGACMCYPGYGPSNGNRGRGFIDDCGWREYIGRSGPGPDGQPWQTAFT